MVHPPFGVSPMVLDEATGKQNFVEPTVAGELDSTLGL